MSEIIVNIVHQISLAKFAFNLYEIALNRKLLSVHKGKMDHLGPKRRIKLTTKFFI